MSYRQFEIILNEHGKLDTEQTDWGEACNEIQEDDAKMLKAHITPKALQKLFTLPRTLNKILQICKRTLQYSPIFYYIKATDCFTRINDKIKLEKYAQYFEAIKTCIADNDRIQKDHISGRVPFDVHSYHNLSLIFVKSKGKFPGKTHAGYFSVAKHTDTKRLGEETMFVFYHVKFKTCCLAIVPSNSKAIRHTLTKFMS
jgi:hypothetical protein